MCVARTRAADFRDAELWPVPALQAHPGGCHTKAVHPRLVSDVSQAKINCSDWALVPFKTTLQGSLISTVTFTVLSSK